MACTFSTSQLPKVVRSWCVLYILTSKRASRHNGVHFSDISTVVRSWCVLYILTSRCASRPQRRALFGHRNCQKWSGPGVFCTFWLRNVLRATTACNLSSLIWPDGSAPAALASLLFDPGATNHWKNTVFRDFPTFSRICIFFLLTLSRLWSSLFDSSLLSDSSHLCFSSVHIVGSLISKLPSTILLQFSPSYCTSSLMLCLTSISLVNPVMNRTQFSLILPGMSCINPPKWSKMGIRYISLFGLPWVYHIFPCHVLRNFLATSVQLDLPMSWSQNDLEGWCIGALGLVITCHHLSGIL